MVLTDTQRLYRAGANEPEPMTDYGFMIQRAFIDLEFLFVDGYFYFFRH